jgi:hypothetical protein
LQLPTQLKIKNGIYEKICLNNDKSSPSLNFTQFALEGLILNFKKNSKNYLFVFDSNLNKKELAIQQKLSEEFYSMIPPLFIEFLNHLQSRLPHYNCLDQTLPNIKKLFEEVQYLEEHFKILPILINYPIQEYFKILRKKLQNFDDWSKECKA